MEYAVQCFETTFCKRCSFLIYIYFLERCIKFCRAELEEIKLNTVNDAYLPDILQIWSLVENNLFDLNIPQIFQSVKKLAYLGTSFGRRSRYKLFTPQCKNFMKVPLIFSYLQVPLNFISKNIQCTSEK